MTTKEFGFLKIITGNGGKFEIILAHGRTPAIFPEIPEYNPLKLMPPPDRATWGRKQRKERG